MKSLKTLLALASALALAGASLPSAAMAATVGPSLKAKLTTLAADASAGPVIVAFNDSANGLTSAHLDVLHAVGIEVGRTLPTLGMVATIATVQQVQALAQNPAVRSVWGNDQLKWSMAEARILTGVDQLQADSTLTTQNGGLPVFGDGDFSVVINDSGIDATHADLQFGTHVVQNVQILTDELTPNSVVSTDESLNGMTPLTFLENVPDTDTHIGHGTHCAGIVGGTGVRSSGLYRGVAPGAKLIGCGSGAVQYILSALGGFEWSLTNQPLYHIRVISNSWGGGGAFDPDDPINIATKMAHDRNIVVVFAAGNEGPAPDTMNPYGKAPWVISVAAGTKEGGLASFSSRGTPKSARLGDSDPNNDFDAPTITAPGTGREFDTDEGKFSAAIISTRATTNVVANGATDDLEIPTAYLPFYTQISGTSMATPHIAGVVALMLDANPLLTPDQVKSILVSTATSMPGFEDYEVGAGYVNAYAAVDKANNLAKSYTPLAPTKFNAKVAVNKSATETFTVEYDPSAATGADGPNAHPFTVTAGTSVLEVAMEYGNTDLTLFGNILILRLYAPDGQTYSDAGSVLFVTDTPRRYVKVVDPLPGTWFVEARGARGLASAPQATSPVALALPDTVDFSIDRTSYKVSGVTDISGHPYEAEIKHALTFRYLDVDSNGAFHPDKTVIRSDFAVAMSMNTCLRQTVFAPSFNDVSASLQPVARAVAASGSTLRHFDFVTGPLMSVAAGSSNFKPSALLTRLDLAVALVRALGQDAQAKALAGSVVTFKDQSGVAYPVSDLTSIPSDLRGYAQIALDKVFVAPQFTALKAAKFNPNGTLTRAELAAALNSYRDFFSLE